MYQHGWYHVAFTHELQEELTPLYLGQQRLMAVQQQDTVRVFAATCPHRGAHLAHGGTLQGDAVLCPFHGLRIHLGETADTAFWVHEYPCLVRGGMVLVRMSDMDKPDLPQALAEIEQRYTFIPGFTMLVRVSLEMAAENAFDCMHFKSVHGIMNEPVFTVHDGPYGELRAIGDFVIPSSERIPRPLYVKYRTGAFSPGVVISELRGDPPYNYVMISTGVPTPEPGTCALRLTLALPPPVDQHLATILIEAGRRGLERDRAIWEHLAVEHAPQWTERDTGARALAHFFQRFR